MNVIAVMHADYEANLIGTRPRLLDELHGETALRRTVDRALRIGGVSALHITCPARQFAEVAGHLEGRSVQVHPVEADAAPWAPLVRAAQKWARDGWRGGLGGITSFDEFVDARVLAGLLTRVEADAVLGLPACAPVLSPELCDALIQRRRTTTDDIRVAFSTAPPGIGGLLLDAAPIRELADKAVPVGWLFNYKPDAPARDLVFQSCNVELPRSVRHSLGRLLADTSRSWSRLERLLSRFTDPALEEMGTFLSEESEAYVEEVPREVEIELTTDSPYPETVLHPHGARAGEPAALSADALERIVRETARCDDALITLGGFGDPLLHPNICEALSFIRRVAEEECPQGALGLCVRTFATSLTDEVIAALLGARVDVLQVQLDAWSPQLYAELHAPSEAQAANLESVLNRIEALSAARTQAGLAVPVVVPTMTKSARNVHELDAFHDGWLRKTGTVTISPYADRCGRMPSSATIDMTPAPRTPCRRIRSRCFVRATGAIHACDEGDVTMGDVRDGSIAKAWCGEGHRALLRAHESGDLASFGSCMNCREWFRP